MAAFAGLNKGAELLQGASGLLLPPPPGLVGGRKPSAMKGSRRGECGKPLSSPTSCVGARADEDLLFVHGASGLVCASGRTFLQVLA